MHRNINVQKTKRDLSSKYIYIYTYINFRILKRKTSIKLRKNKNNNNFRKQEKDGGYSIDKRGIEENFIFLEI